MTIPVGGGFRSKAIHKVGNTLQQTFMTLENIEISGLAPTVEERGAQMPTKPDGMPTGRISMQTRWAG